MEGQWRGQKDNGGAEREVRQREDEARVDPWQRVVVREATSVKGDGCVRSFASLRMTSGRGGRTMEGRKDKGGTEGQGRGRKDKGGEGRTMEGKEGQWRDGRTMEGWRIERFLLCLWNDLIETL